MLNKKFDYPPPPDYNTGSFAHTIIIRGIEMRDLVAVAHTNREKGNIFFLFSLFLISLLLTVQPAFAAEFSATVSSVSGDVKYISIKEKASQPLEVGVILIAGDKVITGADGTAVITFGDSGDLTIDINTTVTIRAVSKKPSGVVESIFYLATGRIKSTLSKLTADDKFEYHTKAAVSGVAGTPPHIIEATQNEAGKEKTNIYLLGEIGDEGSIYVRGFDKEKTEVILFASQWTSVIKGLAPLAPVIITPAILNLLESNGLAASSSGSSSVASSITEALSGSTTIAGTTVPTVALAGGGAAAVLGGVAIASGGGDSGDSSAPTKWVVEGEYSGNCSNGASGSGDFKFDVRGDRVFLSTSSWYRPYPTNYPHGGFFVATVFNNTDGIFYVDHEQSAGDPWHGIPSFRARYVWQGTLVYSTTSRGTWTSSGNGITCSGSWHS